MLIKEYRVHFCVVHYVLTHLSGRVVSRVLPIFNGLLWIMDLFFLL